ncbi:MAG: PAS domain S-box protein [Promethearchaeota archaeon]
MVTISKDSPISQGLIQKSLSSVLLREITEPFLKLLGTSCMIYEKDGTCALELFLSKWCDKLNRASRSLCATKSDKKAIQSGKWLCHESCWSDCSKISIDERRTVDIECHGKIRSKCVPIFRGEEVIGSITAGYGHPPSDLAVIEELASIYNLSPASLTKVAQESGFHSGEFSLFLDSYLTTLAHLIGILVHQAQIKSDLETKSNLAQHYMDLAGDITVVLNTEGNIEFLNQTGAELLGYEQEELLGKNWISMCLPTPIKQEIRDLHKEIFRGNNNDFLIHENSVLTKSGELRTISWKNDHIEDAKGNTIACVSMGIDVTEKRRIESQIQSEKQKLELFIETVPFGVIFVNKIGEITYSNKYAEKTLSLAKDEKTQRIYQDYRRRMEKLNGNPLTKDEQTFLKVKTTLKPVHNARHAIRDPTGKRILLSINASPVFDDHHNFNGILASIEDITEKVRTEQEFLKMRNIESLGVLAGGIAHDFNNILTALIGSLSLAEMELANHEYQDIPSYIHDSQKAAQRASKLTKQLLTFSKGGAPVLQTASIVGILEDTVKFSLRGSKSQFSLSISSIPDLHEVDIDENQISQVFQNLIINADQAMLHGGVISIKVENSTPQDCQSFLIPVQDYLKITVSDQGVGIPKENLSKIFDPYYTTKTTGSGLGLAICYSIIKRHKGYIFVESQINKGTTFCILLPKSSKKTY